VPTAAQHMESQRTPILSACLGNMPCTCDVALRPERISMLRLHEAVPAASQAR
jgi:hypothetical protein